MGNIANKHTITLKLKGKIHYVIIYDMLLLSILWVMKQLSF